MGWYQSVELRATEEGWQKLAKYALDLLGV